MHYTILIYFNTLISTLETTNSSPKNKNMIAVINLKNSNAINSSIEKLKFQMELRNKTKLAIKRKIEAKTNEITKKIKTEPNEICETNEITKKIKPKPREICANNEITKKIKTEPNEICETEHINKDFLILNEDKDIRSIKIFLYVIQNNKNLNFERLKRGFRKFDTVENYLMFGRRVSLILAKLFGIKIKKNNQEKFTSLKDINSDCFNDFFDKKYRFRFLYLKRSYKERSKENKSKEFEDILTYIEKNKFIGKKNSISRFIYLFNALENFYHLVSYENCFENKVEKTLTLIGENTKSYHAWDYRHSIESILDSVEIQTAQIIFPELTGIINHYRSFYKVKKQFNKLTLLPAILDLLVAKLFVQKRKINSELKEFRENFLDKENNFFDMPIMDDFIKECRAIIAILIKILYDDKKMHFYVCLVLSDELLRMSLSHNLKLDTFFLVFPVLNTKNLSELGNKIVPEILKAIMDNNLEGINETLSFLESFCLTFFDELNMYIDGLLNNFGSRYVKLFVYYVECRKKNLSSFKKIFKDFSIYEKYYHIRTLLLCLNHDFIYVIPHFALKFDDKIKTKENLPSESNI